MTRTTVGLLVFLFPAALAAQTWVPLGPGPVKEGPPTRIAVLEASHGQTVLDVHVSGFFTDTVEMPGGVYDTVSLSEGRVIEPGKPAAPFVSRMVAIPIGSEPVLEVEADSPVRFDGMVLAPAQAGRKRCGGDARVPFACDETVYEGAAIYPGALAVLEETGTFRDFRYVRVRINPVQFDPASDRVSVYPAIRVRITHAGKAFTRSKKLSPAFHSLYGRNLVNYRALAARDGALPAVERILVITPDKFSDGLEGLVQWKRKMGFAVDVALLSEVGGDEASVKAYMQGRYDDPGTRPAYAILVGDIDDMPTNQGTGGCASDFIYSQLDGTDLVSDVLVSRLSVVDAADLAVQVDKIVSYESGIPAGEGSEWLSGATVISSSEGSGTSNDDVRSDIIADYLTDYGYGPVDKFYNSSGNDTASNISAAINEGRGYVNYLGHGSGTSWATTSPEYSVTHVGQLANADRLAAVMDVSCTNGAFDDYGTCFAESWLRAGSVGSPTGAVAIYSASTPAAWDEPAEMAVGFAKAFTVDGVHRFGDLCFEGRAYMIEVMGTGSTVQETCEQYVVFGDASLMVRSGSPELLEVEAPGVLPVGDVVAGFTVTKKGDPVQGALVHLFRDGDVDVAGYTDAAGEVSLALETQSPGELALTATAFDAVPFNGVVDVAVTGCGILKVEPDTISCDGGIGVSLWDQDLDADPAKEDTVALSAKTGPGQSKSFTLTESGPSTGKFVADFEPTDAGLAMSDGATLTVTYQEASCDGTPKTVEAVVSVDCAAPVISNVDVHDVFATSARVTWDTDEAAFGGVIIGIDEPWSPVPAPGVGTSHEVQLTGLVQSTTYLFVVEATDEAGNHALTGQSSFTTTDCDPACDGKSCGPDGCDGECGTCAKSEWCHVGECLPAGCGGNPSDTCMGACGDDEPSGWCYCDDLCEQYGDCCSDYQACCQFCVPDCDGKACGDDGCGGACGVCAEGTTCMKGACVCIPDCDGKECGDNGCGGDCGACGDGFECTDGACACVPDCDGKECGDDGCGKACGKCSVDAVCMDGKCVVEDIPDCEGKVCGPDGLGGICGTCPDGEACSADGTECVCQPDCAGKQCGSNGCEGSCGLCPIGSQCLSGGKCSAALDVIEAGGPDGGGQDSGQAPKDDFSRGSGCSVEAKPAGSAGSWLLLLSLGLLFMRRRA